MTSSLSCSSQALETLSHFNYINFKPELPTPLPNTSTLPFVVLKNQLRHAQASFLPGIWCPQTGTSPSWDTGARFRDPPSGNVNSEVVKSSTPKSNWTSQLSKPHREGKILWPIYLAQTKAYAPANQIQGVNANKVSGGSFYFYYPISVKLKPRCTDANPLSSSSTSLGLATERTEGDRRGEGLHLPWLLQTSLSCKPWNRFERRLKGPVLTGQMSMNTSLVAHSLGIKGWASNTSEHRFLVLK